MESLYGPYDLDSKEVNNENRTNDCFTPFCEPLIVTYIMYVHRGAKMNKTCSIVTVFICTIRYGYALLTNRSHKYLPLSNPFIFCP